MYTHVSAASVSPQAPEAAPEATPEATPAAAHHAAPAEPSGDPFDPFAFDSVDPPTVSRGSTTRLPSAKIKVARMRFYFTWRGTERKVR